MASTVRIGDLTVNRLGFGAMRVCGTNVWGPPKNRAAAHAVLCKAYDLGLNFFDTADSYGPHVDEELIAEALHPYPKDLLIATKGGLLRPRPGAWDPDGRPEHLKRAIDGSLKRLKLERIDLYQLHAPDAKVPFADSVGALADGQRAGKIRHVGLSNVRVGAERVQPREPLFGKRPRGMRTTGYRFPAVVPAGCGSEVSEGDIPGEKAPCPACPDRACLATDEIAGGAPDSRHRRSRTP
jgi:hypothetical protein